MKPAGWFFVHAGFTLNFLGGGGQGVVVRETVTAQNSLTHYMNSTRWTRPKLHDSTQIFSNYPISQMGLPDHGGKEALEI